MRKGGFAIIFMWSVIAILNCFPFETKSIIIILTVIVIIIKSVQIELIEQEIQNFKEEKKKWLKKNKYTFMTTVN